MSASDRSVGVSVRAKASSQSQGPVPGRGAVFSTRPAVEPLLRVVVGRFPAYAIVRAAGEVDALTGCLLAEGISETLRIAPGSVVLDLREVSYFGAAGLRVLVTARNAVRHHRSTMRLVCAGRTVVMPLAVTGLLVKFDIYTDLSSALS